MLASIGSGYLLSRRFRLASSKPTRALAVMVLWEALQILTVQFLAFLQALGWVRRVTVPLLADVEMIIFAGLIIWSWLDRRSLVNAPEGRSTGQALPSYMFIAAAVVACSYLSFAATLFTGFPSGSDAVTYHLPVAARWLQDGSLALPASGTWRFSMPGNAEISMMVLLGSGWQPAAIIVSCIAAIMVFLSAYLLALRLSKGDRAASTAVCLIVLSIPMIEFQTFSAYVDLLGSASLLAAFAFLLLPGSGESRNNPALNSGLFFLSGLACGISLGTKPVYYFYTVVFVAFTAGILWVNRSMGRKALVRSSLLVILALLLPSSFWFARALVQRGNPVYPMQVKVGQHVIFPGYSPSQITVPDYDLNVVRRRSEWPLYPWTEWQRSVGYLKIPYGEGEGFGAAFAALVPVGIVFFLLQAYLYGKGIGRDRALLVAFSILLLAWWVLMERELRFGQPIWIFACILSISLIATLQNRIPRGFAPLFLACILATSVVCGSAPLHAMAGRLRKHIWTRSRIYSYPELIDTLPAGSVVLNATGDNEKNFALMGKQLSNHLIAQFEMPAVLTPESLRASGAEYVAEIIPGSQYAEPALAACQARLIDDEIVLAGEEKVHWRIWKIGK